MRCAKAVRLDTVVFLANKNGRTQIVIRAETGDGTETPYERVFRTNATPADSVRPANLPPFPKGSPVEFVGNLLQGFSARFGCIA